MKTLAEAKRHIDSVQRPEGYSTYAWNVTKKVALEVWECYFAGRPLSRKINYFCNEFYQMIKMPNGGYIIPRNSFRTYP